MDAWQKKYDGQCSFVCVCCEGPELAETFASRLQLKHCINTYCDQGHFPTWGQLGCSGFIVCDGNGNVTCKATSAFMEVRQLAFKHVETLVDAMLSPGGGGGGGDGSAVHPGAAVELCGLSARPDLNGARGVCVDGASGATGGRCVVQMADGKTMSIKPANLKVVDAAQGSGGGGGGGCCADGSGGCADVVGGCAEEEEEQRERDAMMAMCEGGG